MSRDKARLGRPPKIAPQDLVEAADRVVADRGGGALTFDAVAAEAGVSKGAVLHHFRTKEALLVAMINRLAEREATPAMENAPSPEAAARAHIERATRTPGNQDPVSATLLAAIALDIKLLSPLKTSAREVIAGLTEAGLSPERAALLHFALDGLWIGELLGTSPLSDVERERLVRAMTTIILPKDETQ